MASITSIAASGMQAAQQQLQASAHNVANLQTPGFGRHEVQQQARPEGNGVDATTRRAPVAGASLESDVVNQLAAKNAFVASVAAFRTADRMAGALVDVRA
jgi:flagellar hook protein FlgE